MANNIIVGQNPVTAKVTVDIASTGIDSTNTLIIYSFEPNVSKSYVPGRPINGLTQFTAGKGYLIKATAAMDLTAYLSPPYESGGITGPVIGAEDGTPLEPE